MKIILQTNRSLLGCFVLFFFNFFIITSLYPFITSVDVFSIDQDSHHPKIFLCSNSYQFQKPKTEIELSEEIELNSGHKISFLNQLENYEGKPVHILIEDDLNLQKKFLPENKIIRSDFVHNLCENIDDLNKENIVTENIFTSLRMQNLYFAVRLYKEIHPFNFEIPEPSKVITGEKINPYEISISHLVEESSNIISILKNLEKELFKNLFGLSIKYSESKFYELIDDRIIRSIANDISNLDFHLSESISPFFDTCYELNEQNKNSNLYRLHKERYRETPLLNAKLYCFLLRFCPYQNHKTVCNYYHNRTSLPFSVQFEKFEKKYPNNIPDSDLKHEILNLREQINSNFNEIKEYIDWYYTPYRNAYYYNIIKIRKSLSSEIFSYSIATFITLKILLLSSEDKKIIVFANKKLIKKIINLLDFFICFNKSKLMPFGLDLQFYPLFNFHPAQPSMISSMDFDEYLKEQMF